MSKYLCKVDEGPFIANASATAVKMMLNGLRIKEPEDIVEWVERTVDLSFDQTSSASGLIKLYPYQKEPLRAMDDPEVTDVTVCAGQRLGKSQMWRLALLKHIHDGGCSALIAYPSLELGERANRDTLQPLLKTLPEVAADFAIKSNILRTSYHIPSLNSVVYVVPGGSQVIGYTCNMAIQDECEFFDLRNSDAEGALMSQTKALRLRMQTFREKKFIMCSSPTLYSGVIHQEWKRGSMGVWSLRCLHCGSYSPADKLAFFREDGKWAGLQWQKDDSGEIVNESIRWICPICGHEHVEADAVKMNQEGCYVHARENRLHRSYQIAALGQPLFWSWREIALAQEDATGGDSDARKYLANTICGRPFKHVREGDPSITIEAQNESRKIDYPADLGDRLAFVVAGIDRQSSDLKGRYFCSVVRGYLEDGSSYLLSVGYDDDMEAVKKRITALYYGQPVRLALIDNGGFSTEDVDPYIASIPCLYYYKGAGGSQLGDADFVLAKTAQKMWIASAVRYQVRLLEQLYTAGRPGWYIPHEVLADYFSQLCAVKPGSGNMKDGRNSEFMNWCSSAGARRDFFDAEKQVLVAVDVLCRVVPAQGFRFGRKPRFYVEREIKKLARIKQQNKGNSDGEKGSSL